jgi:hypothetical protein
VLAWQSHRRALPDPHGANCNVEIQAFYTPSHGDGSEVLAIFPNRLLARCGAGFALRGCQARNGSEPFLCEA